MINSYLLQQRIVTEIHPRNLWNCISVGFQHATV